MFHSENGRECPGCRTAYTFKVGIKISNAGVLPYLLTCGHSVCSLCVKHTSHSQSAIICPVCKAHSDLPQSTSLVNKYMIGQLLFKNQESQKMENRESPQITIGRCTECRQNVVKSAAFKCNSCGVLCKRCVELVHNRKAESDQESHQVISLNLDAYICEEHKRGREYYCSDHQQFLCSDCAIYYHGGHKIIHLKQWKIENAKTLKESVDKAKMVLVTTNNSIKYLRKTTQTLEDGAKHHALHLEEVFESYHALLQLREEQLLQRIRNDTKDKVDCMDKMITDLERTKNEVKKLISEERSILKDSTTTEAEDYRKLLQLLDIDKTECYLEPLKDETLEIVHKCSKPDKSFIDCLQNCGCLPSSNGIGPIVLKSLPDNPSDLMSSISMENVLFVEAERDVKVVPKKSPIRALNVLPAGVSLSSLSTRPSKKLNRNLKTITYEDVKVVHIVSPHEFYVRRAEGFEIFRNLKTELDTWGSNLTDDELILENVEIDQLVMLHSDEHGWVRARVLSTKETEPVESDLDGNLTLTSNSVECFLLDIGAIEQRDLTRLREIPQQYLSRPQFAVKCSLHKIDPIDKVLGWSIEAIDQFREYVMNEDVRMNVCEICDGTRLVDLGKIENDESHYIPISVRDALIFLEFATYSCPLNPRKEALCLNRKFLDVSLTRLQMPISGHVCYCCSPSEFFFQPYDNKVQLYEVMMNDIENLHLDQADPLSGPQIGMPCIAKFTDDVWYRAEVLSLVKGRSMRVQYVDYGNEHVLSYKDVRCIADRFLELPKLARKCCLADVKPIGGTWSQEVLDSFSKQFDQKDCTLWVEYESNGVSYVSLYYRCGEEAVCVNSKLVADKHGVSTGPGSLKGQVVGKQPSVSTAKNLYSESSITNDYPSDNLVQRKVKIVYSETPGAIYVRFADCEPVYISLQEDLKLSCDVNSDKLAEEHIDEVCHWKVSDVCAFLDQISHSWNRGKILDITDGRAKVFAIDIGSVHLVDVGILQSVPDALKDVPTSVVKCHLYGIEPAGGSWSSLSVTRLDELITKNNIYLTKMGDEFNGSLPVELISQEKHVGGALEPVTTINISFSEYLVINGVAIPLRSNRQTGGSLSPKDAVASRRLCEETNECSSQVGRVALLRPNEKSITRPDTIKWKQSDVKFQKRQRVNVRVSAVNDGGEICFQIFDSEHDSKWEALQQNLGNLDKNGVDCSPCLKYKIGDGCLAKFKFDRKWHRAEVNDISSEGITVTFIDYGTIKTLSLSELRFSISDLDLLDIPRLGYYCTLHGIAPMNDIWEITTLKWLCGIITDVDCDLIVVVPEFDGERMKVDLLLSDGIKVQDLMVNLNHARRVPTTLNRRNKKTKRLACLKGFPTNFRCTKKTRISLPKSVVVRLHVLRFVAPNQFYGTYSRDSCETVDLNESINAQLDEFADLMTSMNDKASNWPHVLNFEKGMFCCGLSEIRKEWVRVRVVSVEEEAKEVEASLVDFGCIEKMAVGCIRSMPEDFIQFPEQAQLYQLHQVVSETDDWSPVAISALETICKNDCLACIRSDVGSPVQVDLFRKESCADGDSEYVLAYQSLIDDSLIKLVRTT